MSRKLSNGQQAFLQRLLSLHVVSDVTARTLYDELSADHEKNGTMGRNLEHCIGTINAALVPGFGLEIRTVALDGRCVGTSSSSQEDSQDEEQTASSGGGGGGNRLVRYHAVVNKTSDDASKDTFMSATHHGPCIRTPHEIAYLRLIVERIVERGLENDADEDEGGDGQAGPGCTGSLSRLKVLNLRTELDGAHEGKVTLQQAEHTVAGLIAEGWLVPTTPPSSTSPAASDEDEEDDEDDETTDVAASGGKKRRRRGGGGRKQRASLDGLSDGMELSHLVVGPRTYMELPDLLRDLGLERVPQFILHSGR